MSKTINADIQKTIGEIKEAGLYKEERIITTPQGSQIRTNGVEVLNFCANNYLGLANHPALIQAVKEGVDKYGYGMSSVRFICGTQDIHKELEQKIADFFEKEDSILYAACWDANGGLYETLLDENDAVISDELNHASVIDGIRLCKADRKRYKHMNLGNLEEILKETQKARRRLIATDGVFSMDGDFAPLPEICELADRYDAIVQIDDSHATGFIGEGGRGTSELQGVLNRVDIITSTLGKAMGGASGGFTVTSKEIVDILRQRSRPYLFSNTLAPPIVYASITAIFLIAGSGDLRKHLIENTERFRKGMTALGYNVRPGSHPIVPIMLGDAKLAQDMAKAMLDEGIYVIGFSYPVVPKGQARIRVQLSAAHTLEQVDHALRSFEKVGKRFGVIA